MITNILMWKHALGAMLKKIAIEYELKCQKY